MFDRLPNFISLGTCLLTIAIGSWILTDYSYRPGTQGDIATTLTSIEEVPELWPDDKATNSAQKTLLLFYHPHCPCTKSAIRNLERLCVRFAGHAHIVAFGFCPDDEADSWIASGTTSTLKRLEARVIVDRNAEQCSAFGVKTSGHFLLYGGNGDLLFSGGITPGRGHEGSTHAASDLLQQVIGGQSNATKHWPVYGCPIATSKALPQ